MVRKALALNQPVAINVSIGNTYGAHDGTSLLERFIDNVSEIGRNVIVIGTGNEGAAAGHVSGQLSRQNDSEAKRSDHYQSIEFSIGNFETGLNLQLWKNYVDEFNVTLRAPSGSEAFINLGQPGTVELNLDRCRVLVYVGEPSPYSINQEIYFDFIPEENSAYLTGGIWAVILQPGDIRDGRFTMYLPSEVILNGTTRFYQPSVERTLTIPSTAGKAISVGAYDTLYESYADFSGRGYVEPVTNIVKPDVVAPGVNIETLTSPIGFEDAEIVLRSGTSFATPFVTGAAALLMEWGLIQGRDPFLYGEKVKAFLQNGARDIRGEGSRSDAANRNYPNDRVGWGALCVADSLSK